MSPDPDSHLEVRRIILPSGRTVEVVRYDQSGQAQRELQVCPGCGSGLVQALNWRECEDGRCELTLECPNCGHLEEGLFHRAQVENLEDQLEDGLAEMITDLQRLTHANMAEEIERFAAALELDLILPEDF